MKNHDVFWNLEALSDRQLLERLGSVLGSSRRLMAELIAHLGEVEERRLHLAAACSSMFAYCLKLGMTEDEAYRRIEAARLARRYPAIFPLLADGQVTISVVTLLKHYLSEENHLDLLATVTGKTVAQTRELIAARFPRPDVASIVRKLPERRAVNAIVVGHVDAARATRWWNGIDRQRDSVGRDSVGRGREGVTRHGNEAVRARDGVERDEAVRVRDSITPLLASDSTSRRIAHGSALRSTL